ncbi:hypothetical protein EGW08_018454 [Elysia chlorotica]|uniref:Carboxylesterase type B domain-containing protein n=1 Tax=Elysia chlorotica TaxID=188477 RepID=A0A3S1B793_ELYCH|nr:hypothetical protein EGW08_018454 [Elysia chlorotica]
MIFIPVTGDSFRVLPETPEQLLAKTAELVHIPTIFGYTTDDGTWMVPDSEDDGVSYAEFNFILNYFIEIYFPPSQRVELLKRVKNLYLPSGISQSSLSRVELRTILINMATDFSMAAYIAKQAMLFSKASTTGTYVFQFDYRPSYSAAPLWYGVGHTDEKGFVLGLPAGPYPFAYPNTTAEDRYVADLMTTLWSNFAKTGDPTPQPLNWPAGLRWPSFSDDPRRILVIGVEPEVRNFDKEQAVVAWTGNSTTSMPDSGGSVKAHLGVLWFALFFTCGIVRKVSIL